MVVPALSGVILADPGLHPDEGEREVVGLRIRVIMPADAVDDDGVDLGTIQTLEEPHPGEGDDEAGTVEVMWPDVEAPSGGEMQLYLSLRPGAPNQLKLQPVAHRYPTPSKQLSNGSKMPGLRLAILDQCGNILKPLNLLDQRQDRNGSGRGRGNGRERQLGGRGGKERDSGRDGGRGRRMGEYDFDDDERHDDDEEGHHLQVEVRCLAGDDGVGEEEAGGAGQGEDEDELVGAAANASSDAQVLCAAGATADMDGYHSLERDWGKLKGA